MEYIPNVFHPATKLFVDKVCLDKAIYNIIFESVLNKPHLYEIHNQIVVVFALVINGLEKASELIGYQVDFGFQL